MPLIYYLTAAGQEALSVPVREEQEFPLEVNFPLEYRRLLGMIEVGGHEEVLRGRLRRFPDQLIGEWLKELEDLKMIESREAGDLEEITFTGARLPPLAPLTDEDRKRLAKATVIGGATLLRQGSFLADERVANLPALKKPPSETVILLVEDDPDQMALGELRLTMAGYQVRSVDRAKALSHYLRQHARPDLLLLDGDLGNGYNRIENVQSNKVLDVSNCGTGDGTNIQQWSWLNNNCQQWRLITTTLPWFRLENRNSTKVADVTNCGTGDGVNVRQWSWLNNNCQQWQLQP